jgi:hypothetical protein
MTILEAQVVAEFVQEADAAALFTAFVEIFLRKLSPRNPLFFRITHSNSAI